MMTRFVAALALLAGVLADDDLVKSTLDDADHHDGDSYTREDKVEIKPRFTKSVHPLTDIPPPGDFLTTTSFLTGTEKQKERKWVIGESATVLCHLKHRLAKDVVITGLVGSLNSPVNTQYFLQNFTFDGESHTAKAGEDVTLDYTFDLAGHLDAGEWQVAATVFYSVGPMLFASTFFNETVTLEQPESTTSVLFMLVIIAGATALTYYAYTSIMTQGGAPVRASTENPAERAAKLQKDSAEMAAAVEAAQADESWTDFLSEEKKQKKKPTKTSSKSKKK